MSHAIAEGADRTKRTSGTYDYKRYSQLSGLVSYVPQRYQVQYRYLMAPRDRLRAALFVALTIGLQVGFIIWLFLPSHVRLINLPPHAKAGVIFILIGIAIIEGLRLFNVTSLSIATLIAKNPTPIYPEVGKRVAFTTTIVPGKEPWELAERTLIAAKKIVYNSKIDIWLLDEGDDPDIKAACKIMGVHHFSRKGVERWNTASGAFKTKTKHGNHNAWLDAHGDSYDYVLSVDTDHVPQENFAGRMLGYFRDPDVGFVVGPQVYGNYDNYVTKGAESQAYLFQAIIQRGGNTYQNAMFVGTNHAYRVATWKQIGGFQDSITEDMYTSMVVHSTLNSKTGNYWKSVYTPDVVAVGEGPSSWSDFFSQQLRWARGANELLFTKFWGVLRQLPLKSRLHYTLLIMCYPSIACSWIFGIFAGMVYLILGQAGLSITGNIWLALYVDVMIAQILLYGWLRKYNVSPHEKDGSVGFGGMFFGLIAAPIYVTALTSTLLRRSPKFVVTAKGDSTSPDRFLTFRKHLLWASLVAVFGVCSLLTGHTYPMVIAWSILNLFTCLSPMFVWWIAEWQHTREKLTQALVFDAVPQQLEEHA